MQALNFPPYRFKAQNSSDGPKIWCAIRQKFLSLTPEEWVRQHVIAWLINDQNIPKVRIQVEKKIPSNGTIKRYDIAVYLPSGKLWLLVECKAPQVAITQNVFDQIARYNLVVDSHYLMVTNGLTHYFCRLDYHLSTYHFLPQLPACP